MTATTIEFVDTSSKARRRGPRQKQRQQQSRQISLLYYIPFVLGIQLIANLPTTQFVFCFAPRDAASTSSATTVAASTAIRSSIMQPTITDPVDEPSSAPSQSPLSQPSLLSDRLSNVMLEVRILGICGGIGSGKSTACKWLASTSSGEGGQRQEVVVESGTTQGAKMIHHLDADSLAHAVYAPGSKLIDEIVDTFGEDVLAVPGEDAADTESSTSVPIIDRKKLGAIVFADPEQMSKLERLVWPHVQTLIVERIEEIVNQQQVQDQQKMIIILEAAVLLDAGWDKQLDGVWVITAPKDVALARLMETRGLSREDALKRIDAQQSRRGMGTMTSLQNDIDNGIITGVIENSSTLEDLQQKLVSALNDPAFWKSKSI